MIEFPFIEFESEDLGSIFKPFAFVELSTDRCCIERYPLLIDSGADITLIPKRVGKRLELELPEEGEIKPLGGIGSSIPVVYRTIKLRIGDKEFNCRIAWAQIDNVPSVLGRIDIFHKFDIEFKQSDKKVIFRFKR